MAKECRLCATPCAPKNQQYALLTEVLNVVKLDDTLRTSIIPDDLMRATSQEWRRIQRDNVPVKLKVHEPAVQVREKLEMFLKDNFRVTEVNLSRENFYYESCIRDEGMMMLAPVLIQCPLEKLQLCGLRISDSGAIPVSLIVSCCPSLTHLNISYNNINVSGATCLGRALRHCPSLQVLNVVSTQIQIAGFVEIAEGLVASSHENQTSALTSLFAGSNDIDIPRNEYDTQYLQDPAELFSAALFNLTLNCSNLQTLNLFNNFIYRLDLVARVLQNAKNLKVLNLGSTALGWDDRGGLEAFMMALQVQNSLTSLNLSSNFVSDDAFTRLARVLPQCTTLARLNLSLTDMGDKHVGAMSDALARSPHLTDLNLMFNELSLNGVNALRQAWLHGDKGLNVESQDYEYG